MPFSPFVILLLFFTHGVGTLTALKSYLVALIWIQLWPPVYAILNYTATIASAKTLAAAADMGGGRSRNGVADYFAGILPGAFPRRLWLATFYASHFPQWRGP